MSKLRAARRGFTLIELIVVMSILAVLVTLTVAAISKFTGGAQRSATRSTMQRLETMLRKQIETTNDRARKMAVPDVVLKFAGDDPERAKVIWLKLKLRQKYPTTFAEVFNPIVPEVPRVQAYVEYLRQHGITAANYNLVQAQGDLSKPAGWAAGAQSAVCFLMALRVGPDAISEDELSIGGSTATVDFTIPPPTNLPPGPFKVPCLVDAWGTPITFCRWPVGAATTGASPLYPGGYSMGYTDPQDPKGLLLADWLNLLPTLQQPPQQPTPGRQSFEQLFHRLPPLTPRPQPGKMVLMPVMVSSGGDELLGLNPATLEAAPSGNTDTDDNIFSAELK